MTDNELLLAMSDLIKTQLKEELEPIKQEIDGIKQDIGGIKERVSNIEFDIATMKLTLENEINKNIMVVAEGHLDLSRKLDNAISIASSIDNKMEIHKLYINKHESDINKLILQIAHGKQKIS